MLLLGSSVTISESHLKNLKCLLNVQVLASYATQTLIFCNSQLPSVTASIYISHKEKIV